MAGEDADKAKRQLELVNEFLVMLRQRLARDVASGTSESDDAIDLVAQPLFSFNA